MSIRSSFVAATLLAATALIPVGVAQAQTEAMPSLGQTLSGPGAPTPDLVRSPASARLTQFVKAHDGSIGLYDCSNTSSSIICYLVFTRTSEGSGDYHVRGYLGGARLIDNLHVQHRLIGSHFYNGLGEAQDAVNLAKGESMWTTLEFEIGHYPISSARLLFPYVGELRTAVK